MQPAEWKSIREPGARIEMMHRYQSCRVVSRARASFLPFPPSSRPYTLRSLFPSLSVPLVPFRSRDQITVRRRNMSGAIWIWIIRNFLYLISSYIYPAAASGLSVPRIEFPSRKFRGCANKAIRFLIFTRALTVKSFRFHPFAYTLAFRDVRNGRLIVISVLWREMEGRVRFLLRFARFDLILIW